MIRDLLFDNETISYLRFDYVSVLLLLLLFFYMHSYRFFESSQSVTFFFGNIRQ